MSIKVALFGAGGYAKSYVNGFLELAEKKEVEFVACVVRTPSKVADSVARLEAAGVKIYPSADALYADWQDKLDLVCFPTGISSHESLTCDALKRGINVLCEKPVAGSVKAVRNMIAAEKESGKFVMIGYQHMASPDILAVKKLIASGELGKVKKIVVAGIWPRADVYYARNNWAGVKYSDGEPVFDSPINNAFAHYLNLSLFFAEMPFEKNATPVEMSAEMYRARENIETFDTVALKLKTSSDVEIINMFTHAWNVSRGPFVRIELENGKINWGNCGSWAAYKNGVKIAGNKTSDSRMPMFETSVACVKDPSTFHCTLQLAGVQTFCIEEMHKNFEINEVDRKFITREEEGGQIILSDVERVWMECYEHGVMPSDTGVEWAKKSATVALPEKGF